MTLIGHRQMAGLSAADQEQPAGAATYTDVAVTNAVLRVLADLLRFIQWLAPEFELLRGCHM